MKEHSFASADSGELFCREWKATDQARGVILLVHGLAEHSLRYAALAASANSQGFTVCALDLPGHGRSPGKPGHIAKFSHYVSAVLDFRRHVGEWHPGLPVLLLGHSLGGLISTQVLLESQRSFSAAALSGAAIQAPTPPGYIQFQFLRLCSRLFPTAPALQLDAAGVSRDPEVVAAYRADNLNYHGKISARTAHEMLAAMEDARQRAAQIEIPMLILHGGEDSMTAAAGSTFLHDHISSPEKRLCIYPGLYHEIFNEPEGPDIVREALQWLHRYCERQSEA